MTSLTISSTLLPPKSVAEVAADTPQPRLPAAKAAQFDAVLDTVSGADLSARTRMPGEAKITPLVAHEARKVPPLEQFEGFVLRSFVEAMLPSEASGYFGKGTAGEIWRSKMAEHIGDELAKNGGIGIADSIAAKSGRGGAVSDAADQRAATELSTQMRLHRDLTAAGASRSTSNR